MTTLPRQSQGWQAYLKLGLARQGDRTILAKREHNGPLVVQKPFYPEKETCHIYLLHPPGGVVGGDHLTLDVNVGAGANALITTPAATKFYRSNGATAIQQQLLQAENNGTLEWLPQETILFAGSRAEMSTHVNLAPHAHFIGWEILCLGRPACSEIFDRGYCRQRLEIWRDNKPLLIERALLEGNNTTLSAAWGLASYPVMGTLVATPANHEIVNSVREKIGSVDQALFSVTLLDDTLVCRYLGHQGELAKQIFIKVWENIRPGLTGKSACPPRIWNT